MMSAPRKIVLASSSPYRESLLKRLGLEFDSVDPGIDETALPGETPVQLVRRLSLQKAARVGSAHPGALVIGSDQVAVLDRRILGKPGDRERAMEQLQSMAGQTVDFITGICLHDTVSGAETSDHVSVKVCFRQLSPPEIGRYLDLDKPFNCAGSFKSEQLGITLVERIETTDPTALMGLPLIRLAEMLRDAGVALP